VWSAFPAEFTRGNTLILEDTPTNCVKNFGNSIYVSTFEALSSDSIRLDDSLLKLCAFLPALRHRRIRTVEKRGCMRLLEDVPCTEWPQ
jgi:hypothetical protein